ncbi:predicted GPI-anchored protein 58 [Glycine soja]|uniref:predicted GPI-anchored protein 58 n=1 Tax=Glycine max TaxID=3847 RepID=UPI0003DE7821|nr:predicted GPI-anchored protein 58 [Glycine max]XP_028184828.1 predicted GPI-anchored protein 58 [Glycine soja]|eukprot:XP_006590096.1 predicted GPI-anchored protein 58 [Glycine max]
MIPRSHFRTRKAWAQGPMDASTFAPSSSTPTPAPAPPAPPLRAHHGLCGLARSPSFSFGGGEAPIAQEPQPESEATLEATPEETPEDTPAATPSEAPEEGDGAADTDYVVDMAATQSSWDPWPIPAPDTSLPAPDAPSTPQDNPTPAQDG